MTKTISTPAYRQRVLSHAALFALCALLVSGCETTDRWLNGPTATTEARPYAQQAGVQPGYYRVNLGDTLASVAAGFGQRPQDIAEWNRLPLNAALAPGQVLRVVPPAAANANVAGAPTIRLAWPAYGQVLRSQSTTKAKGITIAGQADEPVKAAADGQVIYIGSPTEGDQYASLIVVKHSDALVTGYSVSGPVSVKEGDVVRKGQPLATMGIDKSGRSTLEFEVRREGAPIDPLAYLPR
ncbi:lipoprotein NlpD [Trinickia symbiotica]|uniref:LysM peptidoglycan-binding domain-containing protein n=1 Tax=Trinickia symbiotica TaxID=863227 RepID=A0A2N7XAT3_9BURK|nr:LysM peptidoglycan-binding domain-containing M23 family metallopeptidase [Trinickia symbiotica]PMS38744.1 LysM peptidoglycan-binding domain-containing protein [Trinickia symbiotica]PPK46778.1 lipoprotein NlpD [Trinickia symbiotica]